MPGEKGKKEGVSDQKSSKALIETLPDGRNRTNLNVLIHTDEARQHFKEISELVKREKSETEVK